MVGIKSHFSGVSRGGGAGAYAAFDIGGCLVIIVCARSARAKFLTTTPT